MVAEVGHDLVRDPDQAVHGFLRRRHEVDPFDRVAGRPQDLLSERLERGFDVVARLRARQDAGTRVLLGQEVQVLLGPDAIRHEVRLVPHEHHRDPPREAPHGRDPVFLERPAALVVRAVVHEEDPLGPLDRGLLDAAVPFLTEDVPDLHDHLDFRQGGPEAQAPFRDLRADRGDVVVRILVDDEATNERCLPDAAVAQEHDLRFHRLARHRRGGMSKSPS